MAQQVLYNNNYTFCDDEQNVALFDVNDDDQTSKLYNHLQNENGDDSSYKERNSTPYKKYSINDTVNQRSDDKTSMSTDSKMNNQSSSRVSKSSRKHNQEHHSSKKQKTMDKYGFDEKKVDLQQLNYQQEQLSQSQISEEQITNIDSYNKFQESNRSKYAVTENELSFLKNELEHFNLFETSRSGVLTVKTELEKLINDISEEKKLFEPDICRLCLKKECAPILLSVPCNHAFVCVLCIRKYYRLVYSKHGGQEFCLKCKSKSDDLIILT